MRITKSYDTEYKIQALKMAKEIGVKKNLRRVKFIPKYFLWMGESSQGG